jgi:subtilisin-like proprotein convertase family protein
MNLKFGALTCAALITLLYAGSVSAQTFSGPGFTILDGGGRVTASCSIIPVSGLTATSRLRSATLNNLNHSWIGDTEIRLYLPGAAAPPSVTGSFVLASPPDGRGCNFQGNYTFGDYGAQSVDAATVGCADATNLPSGEYLTSTYGGGTNPGPVTALGTTIGALTPAQANGNWTLCVFDFATPDGGSVGGTSLSFQVPSAAEVSVGGRITTAGGRPIAKTAVTLTTADGTLRSTLTGPMGYYRFDGIPAGGSVVITPSAKGYSFANPALALTANDSVENANFTAVD